MHHNNNGNNVIFKKYFSRNRWNEEKWRSKGKKTYDSFIFMKSVSNGNSKSVIVTVNSNSESVNLSCVILVTSPAPFFLLPKKGFRIHTF